MRETVIEVEYPLVESQLKELDEQLEKAIHQLNWTSEGKKVLYFYIYQLHHLHMYSVVNVHTYLYMHVHVAVSTVSSLPLKMVNN